MTTARMQRTRAPHYFRRMRRWLKRLGIGLAVLLASAALLAWYVKSLPWRNSCADPAPSLAAVAWVIREVIEDHKSGEAAMRSARLHHQWSADVLQVEPRFEPRALPVELAEHTEKPMFPVGRIQMVLLEPSGWRGVSDCRDEGVPWVGAL